MSSRSETLIGETEMLDALGQSRAALLLEPPWRRKYPPLGLAKIAGLVKQNGGRATYRRTPIAGPWDLICISSLFTHDLGLVRDAARRAAETCPGVTIIAGGPAISLLPRALDGFPVRVFAGYSRMLDGIVPDYSIGWGLEKPWRDFSFTFTSRGCPNRCPYCAVWRIETEQWVNPDWKRHIIAGKPNAMISDNNLSATPPDHFADVTGFLAATRKKIVIDNGLDCKHVTAAMAAMLARVRWLPNGLRMAFDRIEEDGVFQRAAETLFAAGVKHGAVMAYVLFNFNDTPKEADYRMRECVRLGIRPYPQRYEPLNVTTKRKRAFVGRHWTPGLVRAFRYFWLMAGEYGKREFADWIGTQTKHPMTTADRRAWLDCPDFRTAA